MLVDGLALGAMPAEVEREASRLRIVALIHLPLAAEIGIGQDVAARLEASERRAIAAASLVIVTGKATTAALASYGVPSPSRSRSWSQAPIARRWRAVLVRDRCNFFAWRHSIRVRATTCCSAPWRRFHTASGN